MVDNVKDLFDMFLSDKIKFSTKFYCFSQEIMKIKIKNLDKKTDNSILETPALDDIEINENLKISFEEFAKKRDFAKNSEHLNKCIFLVFGGFLTTFRMLAEHYLSSRELLAIPPEVIKSYEVLLSYFPEYYKMDKDSFENFSSVTNMIVGSMIDDQSKNNKTINNFLEHLGFKGKTVNDKIVFLSSFDKKQMQILQIHK